MVYNGRDTEFQVVWNGLPQRRVGGFGSALIMFQNCFHTFARGLDVGEVRRIGQLPYGYAHLACFRMFQEEGVEPREISGKRACALASHLRYDTPMGLVLHGEQSEQAYQVVQYFLEYGTCIPRRPLRIML